MCGLVSLLLFVSAEAAAANFLENPGFEEVDGDTPSHWRLFVEPQEGAFARVDRETPLEGGACVQLYNPKPYAVEPANNWSQNILENLAGKEVTLSGNIKTRDATEAAIWLQCFRKRPWAVLLQASSGDRVRVSGTRDWTPVALRATVPDEADVVVVRCVIEGQGAAWFDALRLEEASAEKDTPLVEEPVDASVLPDAPAAPTPPAMPTKPDIARDEVRQALLQAHDALREAGEALRNSNEALADQVKALQEELRALREEISKLEKAPEAPSGPLKARIPIPVPPLVPAAPREESES